MPRNRPVDYPPVHPPTTQTYPTLAPPPNIFTDQPRFSWQDSNTEAISPSHAAEKELEAGVSGKRQEQRQSSVPPLPVLPDHLNESELQDRGSQPPAQEKQDYSSQGHTGIAQQHHQQQQPQQATQFRPDIPRHIQQQASHTQPQQHLDPPPLGPPLSYEASQALINSQQSHITQSRMQEQPVYPGHHDGFSTQLSAHAMPMQSDYPRAPAIHQVSQAEGQEQPVRVDGLLQPNYLLYPAQATLRVDPRSQTSRPAPINIGPDTNPLTPTSPSQTPMSPNHPNLPSPRNKNHNTDDNNDPPVSFPQAISYIPPGPTRGGTWQTSLFSCSNPTICLPSLACPCIIYGRTQYRLSQKSAKKDPTNMLGYSVVNGSCLAWSVLCGVNVLLTAIQHTRVRKMYEMEEGSGRVGSDCLKSICCCCCVVAQDEKEVKFREEGGGMGGVGMAEKGYRRTEGMMYSPPPR